MHRSDCAWLCCLLSQLTGLSLSADETKVEKLENLKNIEAGKMAEVNQFDIIGVLITEKGLTGKNLTLDILSHVLDIPTFMSFVRVSSTWSQFVMTDKSLKTFWIKGGLISEKCFLLWSFPQKQMCRIT